MGRGLCKSSTSLPHLYNIASWQTIYSLAIKQGLLENTPFIDDVPSYKPPFMRIFSEKTTISGSPMVSHRFSLEQTMGEGRGPAAQRLAVPPALPATHHVDLELDGGLIREDLRQPGSAGS